jgi:hypothetical protein
MRYGSVCRIIAAGILFSVLVKWQVFSFIGGIAHGGAATFAGAVALVTVALALASAAGIWGVRTWGFLAFYPFAVLFTVMYGSSLIPFVSLLFPMEARVAGVFVINGIVLALVALLHWKRPR